MGKEAEVPVKKTPAVRTPRKAGRYHVLVQIQENPPGVIYTHTTGKQPVVGQSLPARNTVLMGNGRNATVGVKRFSRVLAVFGQEEANLLDFLDAIDAIRIAMGAEISGSHFHAGFALRSIIGTAIGVGVKLRKARKKQPRRKAAA